MDNLDYQQKYLDLNGKLQFSGASLNSNNREPEIFFNKGTAAAISELMIEESPIAVLTLDWSYDGIYFQIFDEGRLTKTITFSTGPKTEKNELNELLKLNSSDKSKFKKLSLKISHEMRSNFQSEIRKSLVELERITGLII